jgi:hypothetical protein
MNFFKNRHKYLFIKFIVPSLIILLNNCAKIDPVTGEKVLVETNTKTKSREFVDKQGGLFGDIGKSKSGTNFEFSTSNVLWRATLKSLDFLPLVNADYSGGIVIYDWYGNTENSNDQIKISIRFLNNELRSDSLEVIIHKKNCINFEKCITKKIDDNLNREIKDKILNTARIIKIEESKKDKK